MRIAFVSHEFPPETGGGGIGTYLDQVGALLAQAGHSVDVFCGSHRCNSVATRPDGVRVHRVLAPCGSGLRTEVVSVFWAVHAVTPFDVVEATDFDAPGNAIKKVLPRLPLVVKLHTPRFVIDELHHQPLTRWQRVRLTLGAWRRGQKRNLGESIRSRPDAQAEIEGLRLADELAAPSAAIATAAGEWEPSSRGKTSVFPYPYQPSPALLAINSEASPQTVLYLGRLEPRKGVIDLADAVPAVLRACPKARFRLVGRPMLAPRGREDMTRYLRRRLGPAAAAVEFTGPVPAAEVPRQLAQASVLVAPSHWESFGLVCCEGLAAARAVIGSSAGGMTEILANGRCGLLVPPRNPPALAEAMVRLLNDPDARRTLGQAGRQHLLATYPPERVLPQQLASYERAIERCRAHSR